ncbi:MAG: ion channel [Desulfocapsaceae bacterium]
MLSVFLLIVVIGPVIYLFESPENVFTSIPRSIYGAIVTMTTVGYGDISPKTNLGQTFASLVMILG